MGFQPIYKSWARGGAHNNPFQNPPHTPVLVGGVGQRRGARPRLVKPYRPSVGVPRDVGCQTLVVYAAYFFSVQFLLSWRRPTRRPLDTRNPHLFTPPLMIITSRGRRAYTSHSSSLDAPSASAALQHTRRRSSSACAAAGEPPPQSASRSSWSATSVARTWRRLGGRRLGF